ncbi:sensor domain-containing diguanylate cyclase [Marinobacter flavimaris]|uniref:diguanylate cyclase n=4 Tax=Marinobacteraceae TaxID=2887365 RepID=A0A3D8H4E2_9GAMM|nr:sensor domain-containing diguanylate cyclase [Marinobacter sp.]PPI81149.1 sensor domain-containing diguanylate cyclase [Marinobacter flavimaris]RDU41537.1 sensor domain-containing diguanylate cyclase [Marinobacter flavimaris]|tara:strand:+ start:3350 stop:4579 length:1230 start_codon:yes stop_codon:yes gene_type:complete
MAVFMEPSSSKSQGMKSLNENRTPLRRAGWVAVVYLIAGFAWIAFSDTLAEAWFPDPKTLSVIQTWKGSFFVLITGVILFSVLLRQLTKDRALLNLQHRQRQALRERERQLQILMDNLPGMAYRCLYDPDWTMKFVSQGCTKLTGYEPDELVNNRVTSYAALVSDASNQQLFEQVRVALEKEESFSLEYEVTRKDGSRIWVWERGRGVQEDDGSLHLEGIILDISDRKVLETELEQMATRDPLTGLLNRREMSRVLDEELQRARRYQRPMAVLWVDFDHFKDVNDTYGHAAGDSVLRAISRLLLGSVRSVDSIGRFGGEEFVIVLPEMDLEEAQETAERLRRKVAEEPQPLGNGEAVPLTISVGVAVYPDHGQTASTLCAAADKAMYLAKDRGRNCVAMAHLHDQVHNQ